MAPSRMITITLRFFGALSETIASEPQRREYPEGITPGELRRRLAGEHPEEGRLGLCMIAVNAEYGDEEAPLADGDEVAMIPPVSGG